LHQTKGPQTDAVIVPLPIATPSRARCVR
jgi:hypothetical protein